MHKRAYTYRFYPTAEQKNILVQTFRCCRFVYNWGLATRKTAYFQHGKSLYYNDMAPMLPALKEQYPWHRPLPTGTKPSSVTITKDGANRYFVSILVKEDVKPLPVVKKLVGLDLGIKSLRIGRRPVSKSPKSMLVSLINDGTTSTSSAHASSTKTK